MRKKHKSDSEKTEEKGKPITIEEMKNKAKTAILSKNN